MGELPHTDDCQGCVADRLASADRAHLVEHGWKHPGHTYRMPEEMPPRPTSKNGRARAVKLWLAAVYLGAILMYDPEHVLPVYAAVAMVIAIRLMITIYRHHRNHPHPDHPNCRWCKRDAARIWAHYDAIRDRQARRVHHSEYLRLQEDERRYGPDPQPPAA